MPIQSAITALNPRWYYPMQETSGTTLTDVMGNVGAATWSGDGLGVGTGPELNTHAGRLYSTTTVVGPGLGLTSWGDFSFMAWLTAPFNANSTSATNVMGLGDHNNPTLRGWRMTYTSASNLAGNYAMILNGINVSSGSVPYPQGLWHVVTWTYANATHSLTGYIDGNLFGTSGVGTPTILQTSDQWWVSMLQPAVLAHVAWFPTVLTQTQIQTVSNQIHVWPYGDPINVPVASTPVTVDLTPVTDDTATILANQAVFMPQITNIVTTLLPNLQTAVNGITGFVTNALQTAAGAVLTTPVGTLISHPDPNILSFSATPFTLSGRGALTGSGPFGFAGIYGIAWQATRVPPGEGQQDGAVIEYQDRLVQFCMGYLERTTSSMYIGEIEDFNQDNYLWMWNRYLPHEMLYDVAPGFVLTCWWFGAF